MCGIALVFGENAGESAGRERSLAMINQLNHRGEVSEPHVSHCLAAYTRRLRISDPEHGRQPFHNHKQYLFYNGEIYNESELKKQYLPDYEFKTACDTELVFAMLLTYGLDGFQYLDGQFALAWFDSELETLTLAVDPAGIKPLYFTGERPFYVASELKALVFARTPIKRVLPGEIITLHLNQPKTKSQIFHFHQQNKTRQNPISIAHVKQAVTQAVHKRVATTLPLGVIFSGGLDSSIVLHLTHAEHKNVHAFTIGRESSEDVEFARRYCRDMGIQHTVIDERHFSASRREIRQAVHSSELSEYGDIINAVISLQLYRVIQKTGIKVVLSGDGSDELFAGYNMYHQSKSPESDQALSEYKIQNLFRTELQRVDRTSMASGIETRVPFLDHELLLLARALPLEMKWRNETEKWCLREAFKHDLPDYIIKRRKNPLSHSSGLHEMVRSKKYLFQKYHRQYKYDLHEPLHKDFSSILNEKQRDLPAAIESIRSYPDYSKKHLFGEFLKATARQLLK